jgi:hypothetical protein
MRSRHRPSLPIPLARVSELLAIIVLGACGGSDSDDPGCLSAGGVYQRGKEPYPGANRGLVCCAGLTAYYRPVASSDGSCFELPIANFSCLAGSCGDGACEAGEQGACGCTADCASASTGSASTD